MSSIHSNKCDKETASGSSHINVRDNDPESDSTDSIDAHCLNDNTDDDLSSNASADVKINFCDLASISGNSSDSTDNGNNSETTVHDNTQDISDSSNKSHSNSHDNSISQLLYGNSRMSVENSILALLDLYIHHKWTKASLKETLKMLRNMLPEENRMPNSIYKLFQYVKDFASPFHVNKHFYCKKCLCYNGVDSEIEKCGSCSADKKNIYFFFEIDLCEQIKYMFEHQNLSEKLKLTSSCYDENIISDITNGSEYIRVNSRQNRNKYDLTLVLSTDGLELVASSKSHCWPLTFVIAELPEHLRESFLMTLGIWYDNECKPCMNTFLKPFCLKLKECFDFGINWVHPTTKEINLSRIVAPLIIADAPARAQVQNILNFNGRYGCNICEIKMKRSSRIEGKRSYRIYPYKDEGSKLRTGRRMQVQAQKTLDLGRNHVKGVKGSSVISDLPHLDLGTCLLPEYMHSVLLGVGRQFVDLWIAKRGPWNIKKDIEKIDDFLLSIRPPHFFNRMPRQITFSKFYKASEYYNFILFYSLPAIVDHLPDVYLKHWILFVRALFILLQEQIRKIPDLEQAEVLLKLFVKQTETLYNDRELSYNLHQLQHLVLIVRRWGPLWATSAFPFENFNGFLANCVHGTKHMGQEIVNNLRIAQGIQALRYRVKKYNATSTSTRENNPQLIGKGTVITANDHESELLASYELDPENFLVYARAKIDNEDYTSKIYKTTKTNSYTVQINFNDNSIVYGTIRFFF